MTIKEAKKIIEMCTDVIKRGYNSEEKSYINKDYVISVLEMVDDNNSEE